MPRRLHWDATAGADSFALTRGTLAALTPGHYGSCVQSGIAGLSFDDAAMPGPAAGLTYLVSGQSATCGSGPLGYSSHDGPRVNLDPASCP